ncbi:MAG: hypothetical protein JSR09_06385 [Bacteroidetes bacterium]|nr:hypothetical protein [Bacteroidota bacterium]MBS1649317.1 hypothetical protein [Bacteroidota bacterium]
MRSTNNINEKFEQWLQNETEDQKMYPSETVWENIRTEIHGNKSWPALTIASLLIIISLGVITFLNYPPKNILLKTIPNQPFNTTENNNLSEKQTVAIASNNEEFVNQINPNRYTQQTLKVINEEIQLMKDGNVSFTLTKPKFNIAVLNIPYTPIASLPKKQIIVSTATTITSTNNTADSEEDNFYLNTDSNNYNKSTTTRKSNLPSINESIANENGNNNADEYVKTFGANKTKTTKTLRKLSWQLYISPSVSYRKLEDEASYNLYTGTNVNSAVKHKPALGLEVGFGLSYNLTKNFSIKTGLQFNMRQYYIDANRNWGMATFAFVQNNHLDSISFLSAYSNANNSTVNFGSTKLDNKLYQLSIPIGFEWNVLQLKKFGVSIGGSIQPTFTLNKNIYMISNDYKYYADGESFFRKWNYNSSGELLFNYQLNNGSKLFFGPQIRYQHLPTYNDLYSIKEHRLDYGIKFGISRPF